MNARPEDFIAPAARISALVADLLKQPSLSHVAAEAASAHSALVAARDALEALADLLAHD